MKQFFYKLCMLIAMFWVSISASAYDFEVNGVYYNVVSLEDLTCEVTFNPEKKGNKYLDIVYNMWGGFWDWYESYSGDVVIPSKVEYKGKMLTVIGVGEKAFFGCHSMQSLELPSTLTYFRNWTNSDGKYYATTFDHTNIKILKVGNVLALDEFSNSKIEEDSRICCRSAFNYPENIILSSEFSDSISIDFTKFSNLKSIQIEAENIPLVEDETCFTERHYLRVVLYVPESSIDLYAESTVWKNFWNIAGLNDTETVKYNNHSYDFEENGICYNVTSINNLSCEVTYPDDGTKYGGNIIIPDLVFYKGRKLKVTGIGNYAFKSENIDALSLPYTISCISNNAFLPQTINTLKIANAFSLVALGYSEASDLILSNDFLGEIDYDFSDNIYLESIRLDANIPPVVSISSPFSNKQLMDVKVWVPEESFDVYKTSNIWKDFWELKAMKSVKSIKLNEASLSLEPKQQYQLIAEVNPEDAYDSSVSWTSSNPTVAIVNSEGLVTAMSKGDAIITVKATDGSNVQAECTVNVDLLVKEIQLMESEFGLEPGDTKQLHVTILPKDAYVQDVVWSSDDEEIATVDQDGRVTGHKVGVANIEVTTIDGSNLTASCKVVVANLVKSIEVKPSNITIKEGDELQLSASIAPDNATYKDVTWSSDNSDVASVDEYGLVTAVSAGTTLVKATASDGSSVFGQCDVTVIAETVEFEGICYQRNSLSTLKVVCNPEYLYSGDFFIPNNAVFKGVVMPVTEIGSEAFANCSKLTSIVVPNSVSKISESAFQGCEQLSFVKFCDGSLVECNLDEVFPDAPIETLYVGGNGFTFDENSRVLSVIKSLTLGGSVTNLPPKMVFDTLESFVVEEGENPIVEPEDYCSKSLELINHQTLKDPNTHIYYRFFYLITYTHLSPILNALQNSTLNYLHIGREVKQVEVDSSMTQEIIPTTAGDRYQEFGYEDEVNYQYQEIIVKSDYNRHPVESISINETDVELNVGESVMLSTTCLPSNASMTVVVWSSSNEEVAIVDIFGNVTKMSEGEATITATTTDGTNLSSSCRIVNPVEHPDPVLVEEIKLNVSEVSLEIGDTFQLTAEVLPEDATDLSVIWESSNPECVSVDDNGILTALSEGEATITVRSTDGNCEATCLVTVVPVDDYVDTIYSVNGVYTVYNLQGIKILESKDSDMLKQLPNGVYLVNGKKIIIK